jgi:hypothetical protein
MGPVHVFDRRRNNLAAANAKGDEAARQAVPVRGRERRGGRRARMGDVGSNSSP